MAPADDRPCRRCSITPPDPAAIDALIAGGAPVPETPVNILTALHEASHLAVGHFVGADPATSVQINPDGSAVVRRSFDLTGTADDPALLRSRVQRRIVSALAGGAADARNGRCGSRWHIDEEVVDRLTAWIGHPGRGHDDYLTSLRLIARFAVSDGWDLIQDLAELLAAERSLTEDEVTAFLEARDEAQGLRSYYSRLFEPVESAA